MASIGGPLALLLTHTNFSVTSAVGFLALFGVSVQAGVIMIEFIHQLRGLLANIGIFLLPTLYVWFARDDDQLSEVESSIEVLTGSSDGRDPRASGPRF